MTRGGDPEQSTLQLQPQDKHVTRKQTSENNASKKVAVKITIENTLGLVLCLTTWDKSVGLYKQRNELFSMVDKN